MSVELHPADVDRGGSALTPEPPQPFEHAYTDRPLQPRGVA